MRSLVSVLVIVANLLLLSITVNSATLYDGPQSSCCVQGPFTHENHFIERPNLEPLSSDIVARNFNTVQLLEHFSDEQTPTYEGWFAVWLLEQRSYYYLANYSSVKRVAICESHITPSAVNVHSHATGVAQWLPGRGNAWDFTPNFYELGYDIVPLYNNKDWKAPILDIDSLAWAFGKEGLNKHGVKLIRQWECL